VIQVPWDLGFWERCAAWKRCSGRRWAVASSKCFTRVRTPKLAAIISSPTHRLTSPDGIGPSAFTAVPLADFTDRLGSVAFSFSPSALVAGKPLTNANDELNPEFVCAEEMLHSSNGLLPALISYYGKDKDKYGDWGLPSSSI